MNWTDEKRAEIIAHYVETMETNFSTDEERAKNSIPVVKDLASQYGETTNAVRGVLSAAKVYIKAAPASKATGKGTASTGTRVNKAEAIQTLRNLILANADNDESAVDDDILNKLTGKAAQYFSGLFQRTSGD
jgi:predicted negative regulator of RcsB-dependent stress response